MPTKLLILISQVKIIRSLIQQLKSRIMMNKNKKKKRRRRKDSFQQLNPAETNPFKALAPKVMILKLKPELLLCP